jgi:hypothetical protein
MVSNSTWTDGIIKLRIYIKLICIMIWHIMQIEISQNEGERYEGGEMVRGFLALVGTGRLYESTI